MEPVAARTSRGIVGDVVDTRRHHRELTLHSQSVHSPLATARPDPHAGGYDRCLVDVRTSDIALSSISAGTAATLVPASAAQIADSGWRIHCRRVRAALRHF